MTDRVVLYDAGTEVDEEPGVGPTQKPRQDSAAFNVGTPEDGVVQVVVDAGADGGTDDGYSYPPNAEIIRVTISSQ